MLRRIKRKAPLPPCNGSSGCSEIPTEHCGRARSEPAVGSPTQNGKRTRKFGVISRSSFTRDSKDGNDIQDHKHENGYSSMDGATSPEANTPLHTPTEECPVPQLSVAVTNNISSATMPSRSNSHLSENFKAQTGRSELSSQVTQISQSKDYWHTQGIILLAVDVSLAIQKIYRVYNRVFIIEMINIRQSKQHAISNILVLYNIYYAIPILYYAQCI